MIVVADTSPLNYLILVGCVDVLPSLYRSVLIPPAVRDEMLREGAPSPVKEWMGNPPPWLKVQSPITLISPLLSRLGSGENQAIRLALDIHASFLIIDEVSGRNVARQLSLPVIGTIGVLKEASLQDLVDLQTALERLRTTNFHLTPALLSNIAE